MRLKDNDYLRTPEWVYEPLGNIDLDPCAGIHTVIGLENWAIERMQDGLKKDWHGFVFCNPPFSQKEKWIEKMIQHGNGILLLPERGSTPWHGPCSSVCKYHFTMGKKINFEGGSSSNPTGTTLFLALLIVLNSDTDTLGGSWVLTTMATCEAVRVELLKEYERVLCISPKDLKTEILEF